MFDDVCVMGLLNDGCPADKQQNLTPLQGFQGRAAWIAWQS